MRSGVSSEPAVPAEVQMIRLQQASYLHLCRLVESWHSLQSALPQQFRPRQLALPLQEVQVLHPQDPHSRHL